MEALTSVEQIYRKDGNAKGYAENIVNYITDLHQAANGNTNMSESTRNVVRSILGFEFISKLLLEIPLSSLLLESLKRF